MNWQGTWCNYDANHKLKWKYQTLHATKTNLHEHVSMLLVGKHNAIHSSVYPLPWNGHLDSLVHFSMRLKMRPMSQKKHLVTLFKDGIVSWFSSQRTRHLSAAYEEGLLKLSCSGHIGSLMHFTIGLELRLMTKTDWRLSKCFFFNSDFW